MTGRDEELALERHAVELLEAAAEEAWNQGRYLDSLDLSLDAADARDHVSRLEREAESS